jgi:hypothetical protein
MKKHYLLLLFIWNLNSFAQNKLSFSNENSRKSPFNFSANFKNYQILTLEDNLQKISEGATITIDFGQEYHYIIKENKLLANDYVVNIKNVGKVQQKSLADIAFDGKYFINQDISEKNQFVFSIFENRYFIYIKNAETEFYIEPLQNLDKTAKSNQYVFYLVQDIINKDYSCGAKLDVKETEEKIPNDSKSALVGGCKTLEVGMSIDYNFYTIYGSVNAAIDRTLQILNLSQANYTMANGLSDDIIFKVTEHYIVTCNTACNYWAPTLEIYDNYNNLGANASKIFTKPYDIKLHWQQEGGSGTVVGLGSFVMCGTSGIAVVKNFNGNTNQTRCILSHEFGHNLGCQHDTGIMAAIVSLSNSWSSTSIATINNSIANLTCLSNCSSTVCDNKKVTDAAATVDIPFSKINVSWLAESGIDFKVRLYNKNTNTWSSSTTFSYPINTTFYNYTQLHCEDIYRVEITPVCSGIDGISEQIVVKTSGNAPAPVLSFVSNVSQSFCGSSSSYFSVAAIDGGSSPVYQWKLNGNNVGTNSASYTAASGILNNGDLLSCDLTSNATCLTNPNTSISAVLNITTPTPLSVTIAATETTVCTATSITLTATGINITGQYPYYIWRLNGTILGEPQGSGGFNGPVIVVTPSNTGDTYTCTLSDGGQCHTYSGGSGGVGGVEGSSESNAVTITILNPCNLVVDDFDIAALHFYPNPANSLLNISYKNEINAVSFYNVLGQEVMKKEINANTAIIDIASLPSATYFLKITSGESYKTQKIIKE